MYAAEKIVANADYHFVDTKLTPDEYRIFSEQNWDSKTLSPSAVLAAIGVSKKLDLEHHNLFFDTDWDGNFDDVFKNHKPNEKPLFYASVPSKTDLSVAPEDHENIFLLLPVSTKMEMGQKTAEKLVQNAIKRIEQKINDTFQENIIYKKVYKPEYFEKTFNAFSGNAFGLSHTLKQSGPFRPPIRSPKLPDLYFTGQYTNPGTGVPLVVLSGKNVAREIGI